MIFSELYSAYYTAVAAVLKAACDHPLEKKELREIVNRCAFAESVLSIEPALYEERWQLLLPNGTTPIRRPPTMPLTLLQKRWLNAVALDPRIRLFTDEPLLFPGIAPLFRPEDYRWFDQYLDGDPYTDEAYIRNFRLILKAIREKTPLWIESLGRKGNISRRALMPEYLEYSEKDDKFRLIGTGCKYGGTVNLARIMHCDVSARPFHPVPERRRYPAGRTAVTLELWDERNALERVLMHFAHFEKQAERLEGNRYKITIIYDGEDETEMVIRILSFGPLVRVVSPERFVNHIKDRLIRQKSCGL